MNKMLIGVVLVASIIATSTNTRLFGQASQPSQGGDGVPRFQMDPTWPKIPEKWKVGPVSSVSVDAQDHVWILHRPKYLPADQRAMAAPPVLEFDGAGNFIQGWGGSGAGYEWPEREHGIHVDHKGNVWIGGNQCPERAGLAPVSDDQLLKFTKSGKFVTQFGHSNQSKGNADTKNFHHPADAVVYPKTNELFVADGYGNRRVIVVDADTGAFKRMWGAFGNTPEDSDRCPPRVIGPPVPPDGDGTPGPKQFFIVHALRISNDGMVYVSDREHKRIQVFTLDGKYVTQKFVGRRGALALSPDPQQKFLYAAGNNSSGGRGWADARILVLNRKTLEVLDEFGGANPHSMAVDSKGNIYTADVGEGRGARKFVFQGLSAKTTH